jgi:flagellar basal body-associated protein FliL
MKKLMIAVVLILMVAGGTVAALKFMKIGPFAESGKTAGKQAKPIEPPRFIDVPALNVPLFADDKVAGIVLVQLKLEAIGAANESKVNHLLPRLNDAFLRELHTFIPRLLQKTQRLDVFILKKRLQMVCDRVVGKGVVSNVLIQTVTNSANK